MSGPIPRSVTLILPRAEMLSFEELCGELNESKTDTLRLAIKLLRRIRNFQAKGYKLQLINPEGQPSEVIVLI